MYTQKPRHHVSRVQQCPKCGGAGRVVLSGVEVECRPCGGSGQLSLGAAMAERKRQEQRMRTWRRAQEAEA